MRLDLLVPWKEAIKKQFYNLHNCSMCAYECGWLYLNDTLCYDSGCYCTGGKTIRKVSDSDLEFYLEPENGHIDKIEKFILETNNEETE